MAHADPRIVLLTGNARRHAYVADRLRATPDLVGVLCEAKAPSVAEPQRLSPAEREIIERHFAERDVVEQKLLGMHSMPETGLTENGSIEYNRVAHGDANSAEVFQWVRKLAPDF